MSQKNSKIVSEEEEEMILNKLEEEAKREEQERLDRENSKWTHLKAFMLKVVFVVYSFFETIFKIQVRPVSENENLAIRQQRSLDAMRRPSHFKYRSRGGG